MKKSNLSLFLPTLAGPSAQAATATLRAVSILLRDILFELGEFKARHDHDLHDLKAILRRREAESSRLADAMRLLRDVQATLSTLLTPVAASVANRNGAGSDDPSSEADASRGAR